MLTAHLPSGYVLAHGFGKHMPWGLPVALTGAVLPDLDMLFFYFVDDRAIHHHRYWVHVPAFWVTVAAVGLPVLAWLGQVRLALMFFAGVFLHLLLDTVGGGIMWAAPFDTTLYSLVTVPPVQAHWIASFILHWTFLAELAIWGAAFMLWRKGRRK